MALDWLWWRAWVGVDAGVAAAVGVAGVALMALGWLRWRAWAGVDAVAAAAVGVAGVALGDIHLRLTWQAWYLVTSTSTLRGRRGTYGTGLAPVARLGRSGRGGRRGCWRGRCGTWRHPPSSHVTGVVLGDIDFDFASQAWPLWHWAGSSGALGPECTRWSPRLLAWQAWHLETSTFVSRGRRGTWWHRLPLCEAGVILGDIDFHFAWQAWHLWHWTGSGCALGPEWTRWSPRLLAWQVWHLETSTFVSRDRRGTWWHRLRLCIAGVALMALDWLRWRAWAGVNAVVAAALVWQAWHLETSTFVSRGRRGTWWHRPSL